MTSASLVPMQPADWEQVQRIFLEGIATGHATFETDAPQWEQWDRTHLASCRLIYKEGESVQGWAALTPVSNRCVYSGVAEVSVYVGAEHRGRGIGLALLEALVAASEQAGIWSLQAHIFPENQPSLAIHMKAGFQEVGRRHRLGKMKGAWRDVLLLERRSQVTGCD